MVEEMNEERQERIEKRWERREGRGISMEMAVKEVGRKGSEKKRGDEIEE